MGFSASGSGPSISGSTDVALNSPVTDNVLTYDATVQKWKNGTVNLSSTLDPITVVATPNRFTGIDPSGTTDSSAGFQAALVAVPDGGILEVPAGTYLYAARPFTTTDKSITIRGYGAQFIKTSTNNWGTFSFTMGAQIAVQPISAGSPAGPFKITAGTFTTSGSDGSVSSAIQAINITLVSAPSADYTRGRMIKLIANDFIADSRTPGSDGTQARVGQFMEILAVSGNVITVAGPLRDPFTLNPRVSLMPVGTVVIEGLTFDATDAVMSNAQNGSGLISITSATHPTVKNVKVLKSSALNIQMTNCLGFLVDSCSIHWSFNDSSPANGNAYRLGYGVINNMSQGGVVNNCQFYDIRHAYTDDVNRILADSTSTQQYGRPFATHISNCYIDGATAAAISTHHGGDGLVISNTDVTNCVSAYNFRGRNHIVTGGIVRSTTSVFVVNCESGGESWGHKVQNVIAYDCDEFFLIAPKPDNTTFSNGNTRDTRLCYIDNCKAFNLKNRIGGMQRGSLRMSNNYFTLERAFRNATYDATPVVIDTGMITLQTSLIEGADNVLDTRNSYINAVHPDTNVTVIQIRLIDMGTSSDNSVTSTAKMIGWKLLNVASPVHYKTLCRASASSAVIQLAAVASYFWGNGTNTYISNGTTNSWVTIDGLEDGGTNAAIAYTGATMTDTTLGLKLATVRAEVLQVRLDPSGADRTVGGFSDPIRNPQMLIISNSGNANSVTLSVADTRLVLSGSTDKVLASGQSILLIGSNGKWRQVSPVT